MVVVGAVGGYEVESQKIQSILVARCMIGIGMGMVVVFWGVFVAKDINARGYSVVVLGTIFCNFPVYVDILAWIDGSCILLNVEPMYPCLLY